MAFALSVKGIEKELTRVKNAFVSQKDLVVKSKVKSMTQELREATPVDTGRARNSWTLLETGNKQLPYKVSNSTPYIEYLNAGSSKQAPSFFIDRIALKYGKPVGAVVTIKENPEA